MTTNSYEILAIGTPIIDQVIAVREEYLSTIAKQRGGSETVDYDTLCKIINEAGGAPALVVGGSAANTIKGLAILGHSCAVFGTIGKDEAGKRFKETLETHGIVPQLLTTDLPTAQVACLVSPDAERTMRAFLGAGLEMKAENLTRALFRGVKLVHIEGFLLDRSSLVKRAMEFAKEEGARISFDLASQEIVARFKKGIIDLIAHFVDITFANAEEIKALTGLHPKEGCDILKDIGDIAVVKMGIQGCWVANAEEKIFQPAFSVPTLDTTGAGDFFASGFLHGYLKQYSLTECARLGALVASHIVQVQGTDLPPDSPLRKKT